MVVRKKRKTIINNKSLIEIRNKLKVGDTLEILIPGTIENFIGIEEIHKDGKLIYQLKCHGGVIE